MAKRKRQTQCRHCFVPGCTTGYVSVRKKERKASLFAVPDDDERRQVWQRSMPQADKPLAKNSVVCEAHFDERFIVRNYTHVINCETVEIPRGRPYLTADAIPTLFPNVLSYLSKKLPSKRRSTTSNSGAPRRQKRNLIQEDERTVSTPPVTQCESHETLESMSEDNLPEPEDILPTLADESVHSDDCGKMSAFPLKLEGHEAVVIKEEPEDAPPTPREQSVQSDDSGNMSMYPLHLEGHGDNAVSVKIGELSRPVYAGLDVLPCGAPFVDAWVSQTFGLERSAHRTFGTRSGEKVLELTRTPSSKKEIKEHSAHWNQTWILRTTAKHVSSSSKCVICTTVSPLRGMRFLAPAPVGENKITWCVFPTEPADVEWQSSDSEESSSSLSSQERWDQGQQERQDRHRGHDCSFCPFSGSSKRELAVHEKTHTDRDKGRYQCSACSQVFQRRDGLLAHKKSHAREKPYKCNTCGKRFSSESTFSRHENVHVDLKPFKCATCPRTFKQKHNLMKHLSRNDCNEVDVWESTDGDERPFKCPICFKAYRGFRHLSDHKITHSDKKPFKCSTCSKTFRSKQHLSEHERVHSGEKPFECTLCDKAFRIKGDMVSHKRVHTGEKPFKCPGCPKAFRTQWQLTMHKKNAHISAQPSLRNFRIFRPPLQKFRERGHVTDHGSTRMVLRPFKISPLP
ncbi:unnamed protein product [Ixodes pacificus]